MASSSKTEGLRLNQWAGSDKPQRTDFNYDNMQLESLVGGHIENSGIHLTETEKDKALNCCKTGSYRGNGNLEQTISLGFTPKAVFAALEGQAFAVYNSAADKMTANAGFAVTLRSTAGIELAEGGFKVSGDLDPVNGCYSGLNKIGASYMYIAFK